MKRILFLILFLPMCLFAQKSNDYAYVKYSNAGGYEKCSVIIQFSADSTLDYLSMKKQMRVSIYDITTHSFEVIKYMETQGYDLMSLCKAGGNAEVVLLFKKERH